MFFGPSDFLKADDRELRRDYEKARQLSSPGKCCFDGDGMCWAMACYSNQQCNSRDENGNPKYK